MKKITLFIFAAALMSAVIMTSCWEVVLPDDPVVLVGKQEGTITSGMQGNVTFMVITTNIATSQAGMVQWYSDANGTIPMNQFPFVLISATVSTGSENRTLTVRIGEDSSPGTYYFRITIDGEESNVGMLTIGPEHEKTVTIVGTQQGTIITGVGGMASYTVNTTNIATSQAGTVQWYSDANGTILMNQFPFVLISATVSTGSANRTLTVNIGGDSSPGTYYFRVTIDGIESNVGMLTIVEKTVTVGTQSGMLVEYTPGMVTFAVTTTDIANSQTGSVQWYADVAGVSLASAPQGIITSVSTGSVNRTLTVESAQQGTPPGTYWFRVYIDGVPSNIGMLTVTAKTVTVGTQSGTVWQQQGGTATYTVTTTNIAASEAGYIYWYADAAGTQFLINPPPEINIVNISVSTGSANRTLTMNIGQASGTSGTFYFRVAVGSVESSNVGSLVISN